MQMRYALIAVICFVLIALLLLVDCYFTAEPEPITPPERDWGGLKVQQMAALPTPAASEIVQTWTEADAVALAQMAWGEARGCGREGQAQTMWCVLNRCDRWGGTPLQQCSASGQFYGYSAMNPVTDELYALAVDVLTRWDMEKAGQAVIRELPNTYLWFTGDGTENYFREKY